MLPEALTATALLLSVVQLTTGAIYSVEHTFRDPTTRANSSAPPSDRLHLSPDRAPLRAKPNTPDLAGVFDEEKDVIWSITEGGMWGGRNPATDNTRVSWIKVDLEVKRTNVGQVGGLEVAFVRPEQEELIGGRTPVTNKLVYCCTEELRGKVPGCNTVDHLILRNTNVRQPGGPPGRVEAIRSVPISFEEHAFLHDYALTVWVRRTGLHKVIISDCDRKSGDIHFRGTVSFKNPYGYLPGQLYGFLAVYGWLGLAYFITTVLWTAFCFFRLQHLLTLHFYVSGVLLLGWIESALYHHAFNHINETGEHLCCPLPISLVSADIFSVLKIVPSKVLILLVSMGWGISKPSLGDATKYVRTFAIVYFWWALAYQLLTSVSHKERVSILVQLFIIIPVAALDALLIVWVFAELQRTRTTLLSRQQLHKVVLYRRFTGALLFFISAIVVWSVWGITVASKSDKFEQWAYMHWKSYFLFGGIPPGGVMWDLLYYGMLLVVLCLFYPGVTMTSYTYRASDELGGYNPLSGMEHADDDEEQAPIGNNSRSGPKAKVGKVAD